MKMKKIFILIVVLFFVACQQQYDPIFKYNKQAKQMDFKIGQEYFSFQLYNPLYTKRIDTNANDAFTITIKESSENMFVEYIDVYSNTIWNAQARSLYENFLKTNLKLKSLEVLERIEVDKNYEFTTYLVNKKERLHLIYIFDANKDIFIFDGKGKLYNELINKMIVNYEDKYKDMPNYYINFNKSLTAHNPLYNYFHQGD